MHLREQDPGVVVIGAGATGATVASSLRSAGFKGPVTVVGAEDTEPYNRTAVSKGLLTGDLDVSQVLLPERAAPGVEWLLGDPAAGLDTDGRMVRLRSGTTIPYRAVVLATGATPRRLPPSVVSSGGEFVLPMHTLQDAERLRRIAQRPEGSTVAVLGAGLVGSETASGLAAMGVRVHLVARSSTPMLSALGRSAASWLARAHAAVVETSFGCGISSVEAADGRLAVRLQDGTLVRADAAVTCLGTLRAVAWLEGTGLDSPDGVDVDSFLRVKGVDGAYAAGDIVRRPRCDEAPWAGGHWSLSVSQGRYVARTVMRDLSGDDSGAEPFGETSSFTTQVHGTKLTVIGNPTGHYREEVIDGDPASGAFTTVLMDRHDTVRSVVGVGPALPALRLREAVGTAHVSEIAVSRQRV